MGGTIDISGLGKFSKASKTTAPLLVVFGGIPVDGVQSGVYMWNFMNDINDRFHIFVAVNHHVDGNKAYDSLISTVQTESIEPSNNILYLFSGGYGPGMRLLNNKSADLFSSIFLVDIWMGVTEKSGSTVPDFYKHLVSKHAEKMFYIHTEFGANNNDARDFISKKLGPQHAVLVKGQKGEKGMQTHMRTNNVAVGMLP